MADGSAVTELTVPSFGRCLFATRAIAAGEIILLETPLVVVPPAVDERALTDFDEATRIVDAWRGASDQARAFVVDDLFVPLDDDDGGGAQDADVEAMLSETGIHASKLMATGNESHEVLQRVLLAFWLNMHAFGSHGTAVVRTGSRMNHSCDANTRFMSIFEGATGCIAHVATRAIAAGEQVTSDYLGGDTRTGTRMRGQLLRHKKLFQCVCPRCAGADLCSVVPCPSCHPRDASTGRLSADLDAATAHYAAAQASGPSAGSRATQDFEWRCTHCKQSFSAQAVFPPQVDNTSNRACGLQVEAAMSSRVYDLLSRAKVRSSANVPFPDLLNEMERLLVSCRSVVGERHWFTVSMLHAQSQHTCGRLLREELAVAELPSAIGKLHYASEAAWSFCVDAHLAPDCFGGLPLSFRYVLHHFDLLAFGLWIPDNDTESGAETDPLEAATAFARTMLWRQLACTCCVGSTEAVPGYLVETKRYLLEQLGRLDPPADVEAAVEENCGAGNETLDVSDKPKEADDERTLAVCCAEALSEAASSASRAGRHAEALLYFDVALPQDASNRALQALHAAAVVATVAVF